MESSLRDPALFPHWVWLLGVIVIVVALAWGIGLAVAYRRSKVLVKPKLRSLSEIRIHRYNGLIDDVERQYRERQLTPREAHLALAAIIRAAASERLDTNVESTTVQDARRSLARWPQLVLALEWCEEPSFGLTQSADDDARLQIGLEAARGIVVQ